MDRSEQLHWIMVFGGKAVCFTAGQSNSYYAAPIKRIAPQINFRLADNTPAIGHWSAKLMKPELVA